MIHGYWMDFHSHGSTPNSWIVYFMEQPSMIWGHPSENQHISKCLCISKHTSLRIVHLQKLYGCTLMYFFHSGERPGDIQQPWDLGVATTASTSRKVCLRIAPQILMGNQRFLHLRCHKLRYPHLLDRSISRICWLNMLKQQFLMVRFPIFRKPTIPGNHHIPNSLG